jgi:hypothetical protein
MLKTQLLRSAAAPAAAGPKREDRDELVPDPQVWREFGITPMTGWRWTQDPELGFPPAIKIRTRCFRSRRQLEAFKARMLAAAIATRAKPGEICGKNN